MVMKLMSEDARDIFMNYLKEGLTFEINAPMVETGGEGLDNHFHIVFILFVGLKRQVYYVPHSHTQLKYLLRLNMGSHVQMGYSVRVYLC